MLLNRMFTTAIVATVLSAIFLTIIQYSSASTYESCTVTDKDRISSDMRIYSSCGVFQVQDMMFNLEFSSSDLFGSIEEGKTYNFDTTGKRIPFLSMFPIIRNASEV